MLIAWIMWRDIGKVRESDDRWRLNATYWQTELINERQDDGSSILKDWHFLQPYCRQTASHLFADEVLHEVRAVSEFLLRMTLKEAQQAIATKCASGELEAEAFHIETQRPVVIPAMDWRYLDVEEIKKHDVLVFQRHPENAVYEVPSFSRIACMKHWSDLMIGGSPRERCFVYLLAAMRAAPDSPVPKSQMMPDCKARFGVGKESFSDEWKRAAKEAPAPLWSKPGPRSKSPR